MGTTYKLPGNCTNDKCKSCCYTFNPDKPCQVDTYIKRDRKYSGNNTITPQKIMRSYKLHTSRNHTTKYDY